MPNWNQVLCEISQAEANYKHQLRLSLSNVRKKYLLNLHKKTGRNILAYYSGWLSKPNLAQNALVDEDKNGFMTAIHGMDRSKGLDLFLHTPGGSISATQSVVHYLHQMFDDNIRAVVPQIAMSAGTMIACSCKTILMGKESNLGPIDPQLNGVPAYGVIEEFNRALSEIQVKNDDGTINSNVVNQDRLAVWTPILSQYRPTFLTQCEHAISRSNAFVGEQLTNVMFKGYKTAQTRANRIVNRLTQHQDGHEKHYHLEELKDMGLKIEQLELDEELQDLILTVHHCYMHTLMNTPAHKIIENQDGVAMVKNIASGG